MILERRAYDMKPGTLPAFWQAQRDYNASGVYADILAAHNLAYLATVAGPAEQLIELHRYESLDQWKACAERAYAHINPEYFTLARPLILRQESGFFLSPPIPELTPRWAGGRLAVPEGLSAAGVDPASVYVVETVVDLRPDGPPVYWPALRELVSAAPELATHHLVLMLNSIVGRLHRAVHYRWFVSVREVEEFRHRCAEAAAWQRFTRAYRDFVVSEHTSLQRVAPLKVLRALFERPGEL